MSLKHFVQLLTTLSISYLLFQSFFKPEVPLYIVYVVDLVMIINFFLILYLMRIRSSGEIAKEQKETTSEADDEFHNDFSKVPIATENLRPPKPINFLGNIYENLDEAFKEDMKSIGIDVDKTRKESKKKK